MNGEIRKVIIGQEAAVRQTLIVLLAGQHALIEGVPGLAKTLLARTLAQILGCEFARIQFTPDLMPADITGTSVFNLQRNEFALVKGPIFTTFLLADEINRAPAKTQSALLQAMQEREVTIDRDTYKLSPDFTVFATQNPIESEGTYPLPEAQKDRFMLKISMGWPEREDELTLLRRMLEGDSPEAALARGAVHPVLGPGQLAVLRDALHLSPSGRRSWGIWWTWCGARARATTCWWAPGRAEPKLPIHISEPRRSCSRNGFIATFIECELT